MEFDFFTVSGWVFGLISTLIAIHQWVQKKDALAKLKMSQTNEKGATGYQANSMTVNNKQ